MAWAVAIGLMLSGLQVTGQPLARWQVPVTVDGRALSNAWAGGLNLPQFSEADLTGDGIAELIVHDRADGWRGVFRWQSGQWTADATLAATLPTGRAGGWYLVRDVNRDGRPDVVQDTAFSARVWLGTAAGSFRLAYPRLQFRQANGSLQSLYIGTSDTPGIMDLDADGDVDLLAWDVLGLRVSHYRNMAVERLGRVDTLVLEQPSQCWGDFEEDFNPSAPLSGYTARLGLTDCDLPTPPIAPGSIPAKHGGGGALLPIELTGDNLRDLLISDAGIPYPLALTNGGLLTDARMTAVSGPWPPDSPMHVVASPALFQVDADRDGRQDLLAASNEPAGHTDSSGVQFWRGGAAPGSFTLSGQGFLQYTMVEAGTAALPAIADLDGDGRADLLLGIQQRWQPGGVVGNPATGRTASLTLFRNTGTASQPSLTLADRDFLGFRRTPQLQRLIWLSPAAGDLDFDGRQDLLIGAFDLSQSRPRLLYFRQTARGQFTLVDANYLGFSSQLLSGLAPNLADVDGDGDLDLMLGTAQGSLQFWENTGTRTAPQFVLRANAWGGISFPATVFLPRSRPQVVDLGGDGRLELLLGSEAGNVRVFRIEGSVFPELTPLAGVQVGQVSAPALGVWQAAGQPLALVVGTQRGGVELFELPNARLAQPEPPVRATVVVYPNPTAGLATVRAPAGSVYVVYDVLGRRITSGQVGDSGEAAFETGAWARGTYPVVVDGPAGRQAVLLVVQ